MSKKSSTPYGRQLHDGKEYQLEPLASLDPMDTKTCDQLLAAMSRTAFSGRSLGEAAESRRPLGVVCVGGLITSTLLTLFVIPVMYTLFSDLALRFTGKPGGVHRYSPETTLVDGKEPDHAS